MRQQEAEDTRYVREDKPLVQSDNLLVSVTRALKIYR
jgi:hypothetical protein